MYVKLGRCVHLRSCHIRACSRQEQIPFVALTAVVIHTIRLVGFMTDRWNISAGTSLQWSMVFTLPVHLICDMHMLTTLSSGYGYIHKCPNVEFLANCNLGTDNLGYMYMVMFRGCDVIDRRFPIAKV